MFAVRRRQRQLTTLIADVRSAPVGPRNLPFRVVRPNGRAGSGKDKELSADCAGNTDDLGMSRRTCSLADGFGEASLYLFATEEEWRDHVATLEDRLEAIDEDDLDGGLRRRILILWRALTEAPTPVVHQYSTISEQEILQAAASTGVGVEQRRFLGEVPQDAPLRETVLAIGGALRALEHLLADVNLGSLPPDPNQDWRVDDDGQAFLIVPVERIAWREAKPPERDFRPFSQRGVGRLRIVPTVVDGARVRLYTAHRVSGKRHSINFGSALFSGVKFEEAKTQTHFTITGVSGRGMKKLAGEACRNAHLQACQVVVFPELTINNSLLDGIVDDLRAKDWDDAAAAPSAQTPSIIVAGSWHVPVEGGYANVAPILDGDGEVLLKHQKRYAYRDEHGRAEDIVPGDELAILLTGEGLYAVGICLDFCHRGLTTPYGRLDVDFVLVPSCGNTSTMDGHLRTAKDLVDGTKTRSFIVQQAYPKPRRGVGYVLHPGTDLSEVTGKKLITSRSWDVFPVPEALSR